MRALIATRSSGVGHAATAAQAATTAAAETARGMRAPTAAARSAYSMKARTAVISASTSVASGGRNHTVPTTIGMSTAALRTRVIRWTRGARQNSAAFSDRRSQAG